MNAETIKKLVLCGAEIQDWQVGMVADIIDILDFEGGLELSEICCVAYQNKSHGLCDGIENARKFVKDVKYVLSILHAGGAVKMENERYWLMVKADHQVATS